MNSIPVLSPSLNHRHVMKNLVPKYSFAHTQLSFEQWQETWREELRGLLKMPQQKAEKLNPRSLWKREHALGTIEKIAFASEPQSDVLAYLCLPKDAKPPFTTMICLQGHSSGAHNSIGIAREDDGTKPMDEGDRDFGLQCMARGVAALCIEQRSFGERREKHQELVRPHECEDAVMHALMLGRTMAGERVFDVDRGIDYLETRPEIDANRIGVMGNSGGGTVSIYAVALLDRLAFAMPSCSFCTFASSIMKIGHCTDNYIPGILTQGESADVLGLFAPKPLVVVAGRQDPIFPIEGTLEAFEDLKKIYQAAGAAENCQLVIGEGGHRFYAEQGWSALFRILEQQAA